MKILLRFAHFSKHRGVHLQFSYTTNYKTGRGLQWFGHATRKQADESPTGDKSRKWRREESVDRTKLNKIRTY